MAEAANVNEVVAVAKPKARRAAPQRAAAKKVERKPAATKAKAKAKTDGALKKVQETAKEVRFVQLGIAGRVYDRLNERVSKVRKEAPKQWDQLVKRGEQVQRDLDKAQKDMGRDLRKRVDNIEIPSQLEDGVEKFRKAVRKLTDRVRKAA
ncbi:MAG: hypothetical protein H7A12_09075 [Pseudomonadales bacterium]|jgi:hypothetical protein|nr:hypothetical protein [Pseudomonadales bacterium]MCP5320958.1 hypothetical protein [Pseudomonadales bacterium]